MNTTPLQPDDEVALDAATLDRLLSNMGDDMVLVGGQALAFWMDWYGVDAGGAVVSNDGDLIGSMSEARALARQLHARLLEPAPTALTSLVAQLRLPVAGGKERNIDVLHLLFTTEGLRKSNVFTLRVKADSVVVESDDGRRFRVMDPFDVLEARVHNAVGLASSKGPHVVTQARWAIEVARGALRHLASQTDPEGRLGGRLQRLYKLAHSAVGRRLFAEHGLDVLDAVEPAELYRLSPAHQPQLERLRIAKWKRQPPSFT